MSCKHLLLQLHGQKRHMKDQTITDHLVFPLVICGFFKIEVLHAKSTLHELKNHYFSENIRGRVFYLISHDMTIEVFGNITNKLQLTFFHPGLLFIALPIS